MKNISDIELRRAQLLMLDALIDIDRICKNNKLTYWLDWGTLLGAVRHGGFIPWDDDIDLAMPRADFDAFIKCASTELKSGLFLQTNKTDPLYTKRTIPCKIRIDNTFILEKEDVTYGLENDCGYHRGVFIDIFPIDEYTRKNFKIKRMFSIPYYLKTISQFNKSKSKKRFILSYGFKFIPWSLLEIIKDKLISSDGDFLGYGIESPNINHKFNKSDIYPLNKISFEGELFTVPKNTNIYLEELYGDDYMIIPSVEKQVTHIIDIKIN